MKIEDIVIIKSNVLNVVFDTIRYHNKGSWDNEFALKQLNDVFDQFNSAITINPHELTLNEALFLGFGKFDNSLYLIPSCLWDCIPNGTELYSISDEWCVKGINTEDVPDTRFGFTAYGLNFTNYDNYKVDES